MNLDSSFRDPGGSFPPYSSYSHNAKKSRFAEDNFNINSSYLTFNVTTPGKSLKDFSPFSINAALNQINNSWKYISSNRDRDTITLLVSEELNINTFIKTESLKIGDDELMVKFLEHSVLNFSKGTIFCPEILQMSDNDIVRNLDDQNVQEVYRFKKRNQNSQLIDTGLFTITFRANKIPRSIKIAYLSVPVSTFYPNPMQCNHCFRLGHTAKKCKNIALKAACVKCGSHNEHEDCEYICVNCNEGHSNKYRGCSVYKKEKGIIKLKIDQDLSFTEARRRYNANRGASTFAEAAERGELIKLVESLNKKVDLLTKENESLKDSNLKYSQRLNQLNEEEPANLQKEFDDFKQKMETSTSKLNAEMKKQKELYQEQIEQLTLQTNQASKELDGKNKLLEQIHQYLSSNNLYPEDLENKSVEAIVSKDVTNLSRKSLETSPIEIDDEEDDNTNTPQTSNSRKNAQRGGAKSTLQLNTLSSGDIKKLNLKQAKTVKRLENKEASKSH